MEDLGSVKDNQSEETAAATAVSSSSTEVETSTVTQDLSDISPNHEIHNQNTIQVHRSLI
jgi:hypothetical protein